VSRDSQPVLPGSTIGILGGGQLGRMFAVAARKMGYRVHTYEPSADSPSGQVSDVEINRPYEDLEALEKFAAEIDVLTYEFENIPATALDHLAGRVPLRPGRDVLYISQNRRREKEFLNSKGFPTAPFRIVTSRDELAAAAAALGTPSVLKTADFGYDGKGQQKLQAESDWTAVWKNHGDRAGVVEKWIDFDAELSVMVARGGDGAVRCFPAGRNTHEHHILATTEVPGLFPESVARRAEDIATEIARALDLVGLLAIEFFLTRSGELLVNELAPRPHNSGHYSFDACVTSQFEQQLRAVCGLPLGETTLLQPVIMRNLLGDLWEKGEPDWASLLAIPGLKLHLYGKNDPRAGRKMGHYCILAPQLDQARKLEHQAWSLLKRG
jgi:5-(carboxyamino)imidazole ribonucleotide synthase